MGINVEDGQDTWVIGGNRGRGHVSRQDARTPGRARGPRGGIVKVTPRNQALDEKLKRIEKEKNEAGACSASSSP